MRQATCPAGLILNALEWDIMLGTGHERCTNTSSCSPGFLPSTTTIFLLLIPKNEPEEFMWAPPPLFQNDDSMRGMCAFAARFFNNPTKTALESSHEIPRPCQKTQLRCRWRIPRFLRCANKRLRSMYMKNWDSGPAYKSLRSASSFYLFIPTIPV